MKTITGKNESGFILIWALLLMVVLLILGISGMGTSIYQAFISRNDALHKQSFYQADGGVNVAGMLIEENVSCPSGFSETTTDHKALIEDSVMVSSRSLWQNSTPASGVTVSDTLRDAYYFYDTTDPNGNQKPRTNIKTGGDAVGSSGSSNIMGAGYEAGPGHNLAKAGAAINYVTYAQYKNNVQKSESIVEIIWVHLVGSQGQCHY